MLAQGVFEKNQSDNGLDVLVSWSDMALVSYVCSKQVDWAIAFSVLVHRHYSWVCNRCQLRLRNSHDAEDAAQDIVMRVHANLHKLKDRAQFKAWLRVIVDNYCYTFAQRRARYTNSDQLEQLIENHTQTTSAEPLDMLMGKEAVHQILATLPENARQVLKLRFYGDHSLEEIACILSLTLSAVKARLYRAIEQFRYHYILQDGEISPACVA